MVGLLQDYRLAMRPGFTEAGLPIYLLGETRPELGGSQAADVLFGKVSGRPPALDLETEARLRRAWDWITGQL